LGLPFRLEFVRECKGLTRLPIAYIDISFFAHATEDIDKVLEAARAVIPPSFTGEVSFKRNKLKGEYGNPITYFKTKIRGDENLEALMRHISLNLTTLDKELLSREFHLHVDKGNLYLRLDKQSALKGDLRLCRADPIHIRIRFKTRKVQEMMDLCREIGLIP